MKKRCIIIGASRKSDLSFLPACLREDDYIVCADGGYSFARTLGISPDLIIGDFDSSDKPVDCGAEIIALTVKKDDTDTHYAVMECVKRGFDEFLLCGVSGGREDHSYSCLCSLKYLSDTGRKGCICDGDTVTRIIGKGVHSLPVKKGRGFGIFPFGCSSCTVTLKGFEYEADRLELLSERPMGCSNRALTDAPLVEIHSGTAIIFEYPL